MAFLNWVAQLGYLDQYVFGLSTWAVVLTLFVSIFILTKAAGLMVTGGVALARLTARSCVVKMGRSTQAKNH